MRRVAFHTLGCKVNFYDTDAVAETFRRRDYEIVPFEGQEPADVYVINTCSVTNAGAKKSRQFIRRAVQRNPHAIIVAMGCYAQFAPGEVARIPGVDLIVGSHRRAEIVDQIERIAAGERPAAPINLVESLLRQRTYEELPARSFDGRTRATLKVQDGCNAFCAFCQIPWSRGKNRSRRPEHVLREAEALAELGYREVVVSGVHIGTYGVDLDEPGDLAELLARLHEVPGLARIRLSSIDPHEVTDRLIEAIAGLPRVCLHLHVAAQSGDDDVLLAMRRRNSAAECRERIERLRARLPDIAVTTDIIAGFPGETEAQFQNTLDFCRALEFSKVHVFPYSRRTGTLADRMGGHHEPSVIAERAARLAELSDALSRAYHERWVGRTVKVLVECKAGELDPLGGDGEWAQAVAAAPGGTRQGLTEHYVRVHFPGGAELERQFAFVRVARARVDGVEGALATPAENRAGA